MKKSNIFLGILALELLTIPAMAQMVDRVAFEAPQQAIAVELASEPGLSKFVVSSNAPFTLVAQNAAGDFDVNVYRSGTVNGNRFGDNAQLPGKAQACATALTPDHSAIYRANRKTAATPGEVLSQSVIVEVRYDAALKPNLRFETEENSRDISRAAPCAVSGLS